MSTHSHDEHLSNPRDQEEMSAQGRRGVWISFFGLVIFLFVSIEVLTSYFRYEVEKEKFIKIGSVKSVELRQLQSFEEKVLRGEGGLIEGVKSISIEESFNRILRANN